MTRTDGIIIMIACLLLGGLYGRFWFTDTAADMVEIALAGNVVQRLDLAQNAHITITGPLGDSLIEIHDGQVRFEDSPCTGKLCIKSGWLRHGGEAAACLPNEVSIHIAGLHDVYDAINF